MNMAEMVEALREPTWAFAMTRSLATEEQWDQEDPVVVRAKPRYAAACARIDEIVREYVNTNPKED